MKKKLLLTPIRLWINAPNIEISIPVKNIYSGVQVLIFFFNLRTYLKYSLNVADCCLFLRGIISIPASSNCKKSLGLAFDVSVIKTTLCLLEIAFANAKRWERKNPISITTKQIFTFNYTIK